MKESSVEVVIGKDVPPQVGQIVKKCVAFNLAMLLAILSDR
jgi:hypothetical protein